MFLKILWANFVKLLNHDKSLHKPPCCFTLSTFLSVREFFDPCDCGQISENIFFFLNLLVKKIFFDKDHWFQLLSTKNDWIISLFLISITLHRVRSHDSQNELIPVWNFKPAWKQVLFTWSFISAAFQNDPIFWWTCVGISFRVVFTWYFITWNEISFLSKWPTWNP